MRAADKYIQIHTPTYIHTAECSADVVVVTVTVEYYVSSNYQISLSSSSSQLHAPYALNFAKLILVLLHSGPENLKKVQAKKTREVK